jgi:hypothetical protein
MHNVDIPFPFQTFCAVVAGLLHFLFLAAFSWMCLEGVQLYLMLVKVLTLKHNRIVWFYLSGYGKYWSCHLNKFNQYRALESERE